MATSRLQISFLRTPAGHEEDVAVISMHFQDSAQALLNGAQMAKVEELFGTYWNKLHQTVPTYVVPSEARWYDQQVWPVLSPLLRVTSLALSPGTSVGFVLPPQCCMSTTFQTSRRHRWGRFYLPALTSAELGSGQGRVDPSIVDLFANSAASFVQDCRVNGVIPVVWSPRGGSKPESYPAGDVLQVSSVRCDDIVDIIRRRRWQDSPYHHVVPIT